MMGKKRQVLLSIMAIGLFCLVGGGGIAPAQSPVEEPDLLALAESATEEPDLLALAESAMRESLANAVQALRNELADELLEQLKTGSPKLFENIVVGLLVKMGYGGSWKDAAKAIGRSGDEGIDGIINEDRLGLDVIYIQAKRWNGTIGRPEVQKFAGALMGQKAKKGVFITTADFTNDATNYASSVKTKIVLIDGNTLVNAMIDYGIGVTTTASYDIRKVDLGYFTEG